MDGPVILHTIREQLADEIFSYGEPIPAPLKISPWLAMSLLQKAIRRGESELAQKAAATLLLIAPDRLWRRCGAAAFEEVGWPSSQCGRDCQGRISEDRRATLSVRRTAMSARQLRGIDPAR
jgi:hypothetical protein